jgi:hypothetical protein
MNLEQEVEVILSEFNGSPITDALLNAIRDKLLAELGPVSILVEAIADEVIASVENDTTKVRASIKPGSKIVEQVEEVDHVVSDESVHETDTDETTDDDDHHE